MLEMMDAAEAGKLKALWAIGYDIALTNANAPATEHALRSLDFIVVQDMFLNETARQFVVRLALAKRESNQLRIEKKLTTARDERNLMFLTQLLCHRLRSHYTAKTTPQYENVCHDVECPCADKIKVHLDY